MAEAKTGSRIFLVSSLALGVLAMLLAFVYLENTANQDNGPKVAILVAKHDLRENALLDPDKDLEEMPIPTRGLDALQTQALKPAFRTTYKGQRVNRAILAGTPVMLADLISSGSLELRGDSRAISIQVKGSHALSGLVTPGDYVKLMVTRPIPPPPRPTSMPADMMYAEVAQPNRWETVMVAPVAFRVLAVNQRLSRSRPQITAGEQYHSASESNSQQTVTLEVSESQAKNILEQTGAGQLPVTLLLCPPAPTTPAGTASGTGAGASASP